MELKYAPGPLMQVTAWLIITSSIISFAIAASFMFISPLLSIPLLACASLASYAGCYMLNLKKINYIEGHEYGLSIYQSPFFNRKRISYCQIEWIREQDTLLRIQYDSGKDVRILYDSLTLSGIHELRSMLKAKCGDRMIM